MADLDEILGRIEPVLGPRTGEASALEGGITNRNYRVTLGTREYVVRLPGRDTELLGINRHAERLAAARAASLQIGPEVVYADEDCFVAEFVAARTSDPAALASDPAPVARALRAFHDTRLRLPARFWVPEVLAEYARTVTARGGILPSAYRRAQELVARIAQAVPLTEPTSCHNDLLAANLLVAGPQAGGEDDRHIMIVDWEYAGMGHRLFDLANLAVNNAFDDDAQDRLLEAYFGAPPDPAQRAAVSLMRIVSDAREAAWGVLQRLVADLDFDFCAYAEMHFERLQRAAADPRLKGWLNAAST